MKTMRKFNPFYLVLVVFTLPLPLIATGLDDSNPLLCATIDAIECDGRSSECQAGTAETVNLAQFVRIDLKGKKIEAVRQGGKRLSSKIMNHKREDGKLILQGIEGGRGWSLVIGEETGKMSATIAGDQVGFVVFGNCTML
jgi:hypothetical protein